MHLSRLLLSAGLFLLVLGAVVWLLERFGMPIGRLPGDVKWQGRTTTVYFPWVTCLVLSLLGSLLLWILNRRS
jgi:hypothetical protein